jgi:hypothetical protein
VATLFPLSIISELLNNEAMFIVQNLTDNMKCIITFMPDSKPRLILVEIVVNRVGGVKFWPALVLQLGQIAHLVSKIWISVMMLF